MGVPQRTKGAVMELVFEKREKKAPSRQAAALPKTAFINSLQRQKLAFQQIVTEGQKTAIDGNKKNIRPLWYVDASDGAVCFTLRYGVRELMLKGGNVLKIEKLGKLPEVLDTLIEQAAKGTYDTELQKAADAIKADRAAAKAKKA